MEASTNSKVRRTFRVVNMVSAAPVISENKSINEEWVRFGSRNLFPEFVRGIADNCAPLNACVEKMAMYIAGNGLEFMRGEDTPHEEAANKWRELVAEDGEEYFLQATALDLALLNTKAWVVRGNRIGVPAAVDHLDVARVRSGKKVDGKVRAFHFSSNWEQPTRPEYKPVKIPAFGERPEDGKTLIYTRTYKQLRDYYGEPHWLAALADAEVLSRIPIFNRTQIDTGFRPAVWVHVFTNKDEADIAELDADVEEVFTGADGKTYVITHGTTQEGAPNITKLERGDHAGELDATRKVSKEEIWHSYGMPPILMGANVDTGLSGKGLAIEQELSMFTRTVVIPFQKRITSDAKRILEACGISGITEVRVKQLTPFDPATDAILQRQTYLARTTLNMDLEANGLEPRPANDPRGEMLLCELLKGSGLKDVEQDGPDKPDPDA